MGKKFYPYELRKKLGLSLKTFSNIILCSGLSNLSMIESGKRKLTMYSTLLSDLLKLAIIEAEKSVDNSKESNNKILQPFLNKQIKILNRKLALQELHLIELNSKAEALALFIKTAQEFKKNPLMPELNESLIAIDISLRKGTKQYKLYILKISKLKINIAAIKGAIENVKEQNNIISVI